MKHKLFIIITILLFALMQYSVFPVIPLIPITPNLLLGLTVAYSLMRGSISGMTVGICCGFCVDIFSDNVIGVYMLIFCLIGYAMGAFNKLFFPEEVKLPLFAIALGDFIYGCVIYIVFFLLRKDLGFGSYLLTLILPEVVYTLVCMIFFYPVILKIESKFIEKEKGNEKKFV